MAWRFLSTVILLAAAMAPLAAEDRVIVTTGADNAGRRTLTGEIRDFNGKELKIGLTSGQELSVPASRVIEVQTTRPAKQVEAEAHVQKREFPEALEAFRLALREESRGWAKRRIMADVVTCYESAGDLPNAGKMFELLMKGNEFRQFLDRAPLLWTSGLIDTQQERQAAAWLASSDASLQLLGASWSLAGAGRNDAIAALRKLSNNADARVVHLADAQLWRANIATVGTSELKAWELQIERMPPELRPGPYLVLGKGWAMQDARMLGGREELHRRAIWAFMKPAILWPERPALALQGLSGAAESLAKLQWTEETKIVLGEIAKEFPETEAGGAAERRLKLMK
jgi:hypothetical protein